MAGIIEFSKSDKLIGLVVKPVRIGPESQMADIFMEQTISELMKKKDHYAIFIEPQLDTGFPDIVIVSFSPHVFDTWREERAKLTVVDIKVLHHLCFVKGASTENMEVMLGMTHTRLIHSLERLQSANLITCKRAVWKPGKLKSLFGINSIVAIEAKIKNWSEVFRQAEMNWWFASESYVLSPVKQPQKQVLEKANRLDLGLYSMPMQSPITCLRTSKKEPLPSSYASWLFNEWIGRRLCA